MKSRQKKEKKKRWTENEGSILSKIVRVDTLFYAQKGHRIRCMFSMEMEVWECSSLPLWLRGVWVLLDGEGLTWR